MQDNPYSDFMAVKELKMFFGRRELLLSLFRACYQRQCLSLRGTRQIGKSSLLRHMQSRELQQELGVTEMLSRQVFVFVSMRDYIRSSSEEDFFRDVYKNIVKNAPYNCAQQEGQGKEWSELFKLCLQDLHEAGYHVVLLLDVFDKVIDEPQFRQQFFSYLRAHADHGLISYITTSILPLHTILINGTPSPFFNIFRSATIGALEMEEAVELITAPSARAGLPCSSEEVDWIIEKAGRHPFFLQLSCYHLLEEKSKLKTRQSLDFEQLAMKIYTELAPHFESIWKDLSKEQQSNLRYEMQRANRPDQGRSIADKMEELSESALFRQYIRTTFHVEQAELSSKELKTILEHYQDRDFLAKSVLATMHYMEVKRDRNSVGSHQIGMLVQEFLREALERMKPAGVRTDVSEVWRLYNIIYYRYIGNQMQGEYIMPKISIGRRQYFRSQIDAIKELQRHLLELNNESFGRE
jgi:AAA-like domain